MKDATWLKIGLLVGFESAQITPKMQRRFWTGFTRLTGLENVVESGLIIDAFSVNLSFVSARLPVHRGNNGSSRTDRDHYWSCHDCPSHVGTRLFGIGLSKRNGPRIAQGRIA